MSSSRCGCLFGFLAAICAIQAQPGAVGSNFEAGWHQATIKQSGTIRHYRYYIPARLPANSPLLILLHAGNQGMFKVTGPMGEGGQEWQNIAEETSFLLVVPNGVNPQTGDPASENQAWNDCRADRPGARALSNADDVGFIRTLIQWAATEFRVDRSRVYAAGKSNGGMLCYRLAMEIPELLAGVAAFNANLPDEGECQARGKPVPIMIVNSTTDPLLPWTGGIIAGNPVLSAEQTRDYWVRTNRAESASVQIETLPDRAGNDGSVVKRERFPAGPGAAEVLFYRVEGGGHLMPSMHHETIRPEFGRQNRDVESAHEAWEFLRRQSRRPD